MNGTIKTYLPEKHYGFIKGEDDKDYFFHDSEFKDKDQIVNLCEQAHVSFEQKITPKGYKAINCKLVERTSIKLFDVPNEFITSKTSNIRGWEIIECADWVVRGSSRHSPDDAKDDVVNKASSITANALINMQYYKTTGSEAGTGKGTHFYTIHNFVGRPVVIAKRNARGVFREQALIGLNEFAKSYKKHLIDLTKSSKKKRNIFWLVLLILSLISLIVVPDYAIGVAIGLGVIGLIFGNSSDYDSWLEESRY